MTLAWFGRVYAPPYTKLTGGILPIDVEPINEYNIPIVIELSNPSKEEIVCEAYCISDGYDNSVIDLGTIKPNESASKQISLKRLSKPPSFPYREEVDTVVRCFAGSNELGRAIIPIEVSWTSRGVKNLLKYINDFSTTEGLKLDTYTSLDKNFYVSPPSSLHFFRGSNYGSGAYTTRRTMVTLTTPPLPKGIYAMSMFFAYRAAPNPRRAMFHVAVNNEIIATVDMIHLKQKHWYFVTLGLGVQADGESLEIAIIVDFETWTPSAETIGFDHELWIDDLAIVVA